MAKGQNSSEQQYAYIVYRLEVREAVVKNQLGQPNKRWGRLNDHYGRDVKIWDQNGGGVDPFFDPGCQYIPSFPRRLSFFKIDVICLCELHVISSICDFFSRFT